MIETLWHDGREYPAYEATGNAARFCMPFAQEVCKGTVYDIGCNRSEWSFPGAILIDPAIDPELDAMNLPALTVDGIFSSHCLEHLPNWVSALDHWTTRLRRGGTLFLYLPHPDQSYWLPWNNRKHIHILYPDMIKKYLEDSNQYHKIFVSERDANHSFIAFAERI